LEALGVLTGVVVLAGIRGNILGSFSPVDFLAAIADPRAENDLLPLSFSVDGGLGLGKPEADP